MKKLLTLVLSLMLAASAAPTAVFAETGEDLSEATIEIENATYIFNGKAHEPGVSVSLGTRTLKEGEDYTVSYVNNVKASTATTPNKIVITGMGKYGGTKTLEFRIKGRPNRIVTGADSYTKYLTSKEFSLDAEAAEAKQLIYTSGNEEVVTVSDTGRVTVKGTGAATITIKTSGTTGFEPAEKSVTVTVKPTKPVVTLTSPQKKQVKVTWTKQEGATKYQVRYGRQGKYYYRTCKHIDSQFAKTYTYLNNRTSGKTYYIKVRSITEMPDGTIVYGNWSEVQKIKSK